MKMQELTRREFLATGVMAAAGLRAGAMWGQSAPGGVVVKTPLGALRGASVDGVNVFKGVPFAEPPVRFRPPVKKLAWSGERDATRFAPEAMQPGQGGARGNEDCLYLNVWAPTQPSKDAGGYPVLVWVHGGGFVGGASHTALEDGAVFAREGIICVSIAYRLGVFGFLDVSPLLGAEYAGSANNGLRDVMAALEWVQQNIGAFGGNARRVTMGGQSAGAKLVDILMGVPEAIGLYTGVISESGGAERVAAASGAAEVAKGFATAFGKDASALKTVDAAELIAAQNKLMGTWPLHFPLRPELDVHLLPRLPVETIAAGNAHGKRLLIGTNHDESAAFIGPHPVHDATAADLGNVSTARFAQVFAEYKKLYPQWSAEQLRIRAVTAEEYWVPSVRVADACVRGGGEAWMYRLDFAPANGRMQGLAEHGEELAMVWDKPLTTYANADAEAALTTQVHAAWVAFVKGDAPAAQGVPAWPEYHAGTRPTMILDAVSKVEERPMERELRLWDL
jgi:para-nitrobenzyl esterase